MGRPYETCTLIVVGAVFRRRILFSRGADTPSGHRHPCPRMFLAGKSARPTNEWAP